MSVALAPLPVTLVWVMLARTDEYRCTTVISARQGLKTTFTRLTTRSFVKAASAINSERMCNDGVHLQRLI